MNVKVGNIRKAGYKGFLMVTDQEMPQWNRCKMNDDNQFFTGVMSSTALATFMNYK